MRSPTTSGQVDAEHATSCPQLCMPMLVLPGNKNSFSIAMLLHLVFAVSCNEFRPIATVSILDVDDV